MSEPMSIEDRLGLNKFQVDEDHAHIRLNPAVCKDCVGKPCTWACPALLYKLKDGVLKFDYAGCLECGTCRIICPSNQEMVWEYPRATFGIQYRYG